MSARDVIANTFGVKEIFGHRDGEPCKLCLNTADSILSALDAAGFAVVPVEPTEGVIAACSEAVQGTLSEMSMKYIVGDAKVYITGSFDEAAVWKAMLKAAQEDSRE